MIHLLNYTFKMATEWSWFYLFDQNVGFEMKALSSSMGYSILLIFIDNLIVQRMGEIYAKPVQDELLTQLQLRYEP